MENGKLKLDQLNMVNLFDHDPVASSLINNRNRVQVDIHLLINQLHIHLHSYT